MSRDEIAIARRKIGVVHQDCQFLDHLSVIENIALPLEVAGQDRLSDQMNLKELLAWVGLNKRAEAYPPELSGGERQRAALARAIIMSPDIILADEPSGNLDSTAAKQLHKLFFELRDKLNQTFIIVTHNEELANMADRKLTMNDGKIVAKI